MIVMAAGGPWVDEILAGIERRDPLAISIARLSWPPAMPPIALKRLRDGRLIALAGCISMASPGMPPHTIARNLGVAGREIEGGRSAWHPGLADLAAVRTEVSAVIAEMLTWLPRNSRTGKGWPTARTIYEIIR